MPTQNDAPAKTPVLWLNEMLYPELWEAVDEALVKTADEFPVVGPLSQAWLNLPKRIRARLHGHIKSALRRRMPSP